jgi:hypothetical protein
MTKASLNRSCPAGRKTRCNSCNRAKRSGTWHRTSLANAAWKRSLSNGNGSETSCCRNLTDASKLLRRANSMAVATACVLTSSPVMRQLSFLQGESHKDLNRIQFRARRSRPKFEEDAGWHPILPWSPSLSVRSRGRTSTSEFADRGLIRGGGTHGCKDRICQARRTRILTVPRFGSRDTTRLACRRASSEDAAWS